MKIPAFFIFLSFFSQQILAVTIAELEISRNNALAWIIQNQNGDGSWGKQVDLRVQTTAEAIQVLARYGMKGSFSTLAGQSWLSNQIVNSTDSLSAIVKALSLTGADHSQQLTQLVSLRGGNNSSWGAYSGYRESVIDTVVASEALKMSGNNDDSLINALSFVVTKQHTDGSWSMNESPTQSSILSTAQVLMTLSRYSTIYGVDSFINSGLVWLHGQKKSDGGYAEDSITTTGQVYETAQVARAILLAQSYGNTTASNTTHQTDLRQAQDFLVNQQQAGGDWEAGVLPTLSASQMTTPETLADFDHDGIPDQVETVLGTNLAKPDSHQFSVGNGEAIEGITYALDVANIHIQQTLNTTLYSPQGGSGTYTWSIVYGSLPQGIKLDYSSGVLSGSASQIGYFNFTYQVADEHGWFENVLAKITVTPQP